jgi:hypothetical protein
VSNGRDVVIEQFTGYLIGECGLAASTIVNYRAVAGRFLAGCRWESGALAGVSGESVAIDGPAPDGAISRP